MYQESGVPAGKLKGCIEHKEETIRRAEGSQRCFSKLEGVAASAAKPATGESTAA